jgi:hypothetical protein
MGGGEPACPHANYIEHMDGSGKCLDCGLVKEAEEDV